MSSHILLNTYTAFTAIDCLTAKASSSSETPKPFVFISAAEAGWTFKSPVVFLEKYLTAKRAVEDKAMSNDALRTVILRPSLIWTWDKPAALASVIPFYIGNSLGLPFVDKPVLLNTLVDAALASLQDKSVQGILRFSQMEELAAKVTRL